MSRDALANFHRRSIVAETMTRTVRRAALVAFLGLTVITSTACSDPKVSLATGPREYTESDYEQVLKKWTREKSLIAVSELDTLLTVTSTFESWDFRWAYVVKYANDYRLTVEQRRSLLEKTLAETRDSHRFYVALYGSKVRWTDLTRANSAWIVRLIDDEGNETAPLSIELIDRPGPLEKRYFPYTSVFRNVFRIKFPTTTPDGRATISPNSRWLGLRFAGAEGNEELRWVLEDDASKQSAFGPDLAPREAREALAGSSSTSATGTVSSFTLAGGGGAPNNGSTVPPTAPANTTPPAP